MSIKIYVINSSVRETILYTTLNWIGTEAARSIEK